MKRKYFCTFWYVPIVFFYILQYFLYFLQYIPVFSWYIIAFWVIQGVGALVPDTTTVSTVGVCLELNKIFKNQNHFFKESKENITKIIILAQYCYFLPIFGQIKKYEYKTTRLNFMQTF